MLREGSEIRGQVAGPTSLPYRVPISCDHLPLATRDGIGP